MKRIVTAVALVTLLAADSQAESLQRVKYNNAGLTVAGAAIRRSGQQSLQRVKYNNPGLTVDLGVGLWAWPLPVDYDDDGDWDLLVSCSDTPYNGLYLFENPGPADAAMPVFLPVKRIGAGRKNIGICYPDGKPRVLIPGAELTGFTDGDLKTQQTIFPQTTFTRGGRVRANQWSYVDFEGDGDLDVIVGQGHWSDYGWDNAFNNQGEWTRGPLHGYVYLIRNTGTAERPQYAKPVQVTAGGKPVDVFGMPSPQFADFDGDDDLDLICGEFLDGFTWFENTGTRSKPRYAKGRRLLDTKARPVTMDLQMITPTAIDWDRDGDTDLICGDEDGRVAFLENTGRVTDGVPVFKQPRYFQQQADAVKFGALVTPVSVDWDGDGDEDIIAGNTAGYIGFIENLDGGNPPKWAAPQRLTANGKVIRIQAGPNGSIQGPAEAKWGYTTLSVADWDHDGLLDLVVNSIWGRIIWYRNIGTRTVPRLTAARPVEVEWKTTPPKPKWNWWKPGKTELVTQWRTTPVVVDWDRDGLNDLVMLDHEGYLALYRREKRNGKLVLTPGRRIFTGGTYNHRHQRLRGGQAGFLRLNNGTAGKSGRRKLCIVDFNGDGRRDLLVNSRNVNLLLNVSSDVKHPKFRDAGPLDSRRLAGHTTSPTTVDWNSDGVRDLLVGAEDGHLYYKPNPVVSKPGATKPATQKANPKTATSPGKEAAGKQRLNVLFIGVDDLRVELGCYGNTLVKSPHIDKLAKRGTVFTRAYCQQAVCNPSRASMLTGMRPAALGIWDLPTHFRENHPDIVTLPQWFKQHGYFAQNIGKIFHNWRQDDYKGDPKSWSVPAVMHYNNHGADKPQVRGKLPPDLNKVPKCEMRDVPDDAYFDGRIAKLAMKALRRLKDNRQPFFLAVGFWKPHSPFNAPKKYWDMYERSNIMPPANPDPPKDVPKIALHDSREILRSFRRRPGGRPTAKDTLALRHGYYAATSYVDAQVGKVLNELDRLELRENTVIVFFSDHGYHLGEHGLWAKTSNFELDARVPLMIATPNHPGGQRSDALVELLDLYPTLTDLCGLPMPKHVQGPSLRRVLSKPGETVKDAAFTWHPRPAYPPGGTKPKVMGYSMRTSRYRYTEWREFKTGKVLQRELYDHMKDPRETVNVVARPEFKTVVKSLALRLAKTHPRRPVSTPEKR